MTSVCWQINFYPKEEVNNNFKEFLEDFFEVVSQNYADDGKDEFIGYKTDFIEQEMQSKAKEFGLILPEYKITKLESENWLKDYGIDFSAFETDDFCIYGVNEKNPPKSEKTKLQIYATTAFGSNHPTTRGCIKALSLVKKQNPKIERILDIGCGSGILSLCAGKLWQKAKITASDIDEESVSSTKFNIENNKLEKQIDVILSDGFNNPEILKYAPFDLVMSNIFANPLKEFAPLIAKNLKDNGVVIISGFIEEQKDEVIKAYKLKNLKLLKIYADDNWQIAIMQKG